MTSLGLSFTSDVITQLLQEEKIFPLITRVIGLVKPEICPKLLKKLSEKLRAKFPATTRGYSMVKIALPDDDFLEVFLNASKSNRRSITAAKRKEKEKKERPKKFNKSKT